jgi:hypothetical protein
MSSLSGTAWTVSALDLLTCSMLEDKWYIGGIILLDGAGKLLAELTKLLAELAKLLAEFE